MQMEKHDYCQKPLTRGIADPDLRAIAHVIE
jgi:hypothetical protein